MKRKIVCLMAAIMCFSMTACEKTPDKSLVTQKNIDRLEKAAKETPKDGSTLKDIIETTTDTYDFNYESDARSLRFLSPVAPGRKPGVSMIIPISSGKSISFPTSFPLMSTHPSSGLKKPHMHFIMTVLPLPLLPTMPCILPASNSLLIP